MNRILCPNLKTRRVMAVALTLSLIAVFFWIHTWETTRRGAPTLVSGLTLLTCLILLMLLGVRRRLPFWPLGSVSTWTQIHLYMGAFTTAIYLLHVPVLIASGRFESFLSIVFLMVTASGFYGLYVSRTLPKKMTAVQGQHRFDRLQWDRNQIASVADQTYRELSEPTAKQVLEEFYQNALSPFFISRPSLAYVIAPNGNRRRRLLGGLKELDRYLERDGRRAAGQFAALVQHRDDLDYQFALQLRLRGWVVFHSLLSLVLLAASLVHAAIALRFAG
jgi:hypothetical protein